MPDHRDLQNTRREDILKAAKYHYKHERKDVVEVLRAVISAHNGIPIEDMNDKVILYVLMHEVHDEVNKDTRSFQIFMDDFIRAIWWNDVKLTSERSNLRMVLDTYLSRVTLLHKQFLKDQSLPDNCPVMEQFIKES